MSAAGRTAAAYVKEFHERGQVLDSFDTVLEECDLCAGDQETSGIWVSHPDQGDYESYLLEGRVSDERYAEIEQGADLTETEERLWRAAWMDRRLGSEHVTPAYLWRLCGRAGREMWFVTFHDMEGEYSSDGGAFRTEADARAWLAANGEFSE